MTPSRKWPIKISANPGLASSGFEQLGPGVEWKAAKGGGWDG